MSTLRDDLIALVDDVRGIPDELGLRLHAVVVEIRTYTEGLAGIGTAPATTTTTLTPVPRVRKKVVYDEERGGRIDSGDLTVDRISATFTEAQLDPPGNAVWIIGGEPYRLKELTERSFDWSARVERLKQ